MNPKIIFSAYLAFLISITVYDQALGSSSRNTEVSQEQLEEFARCMTNKGWVVYSSFTCSACRAQQELFGEASAHLKIIECNPHAPDSKVEQCLNMNIRYTPTWVMIQKGTEVKRAKGYQKLDDLASITGCSL